MKFTDPRTGYVVECTPAEYAELNGSSGLKLPTPDKMPEANANGVLIPPPPSAAPQKIYDKRPLDRAPRPPHLTGGQMETWDALDAYRKEGLSTAGLAEILGISHSAASQRVGVLRSEGIIIDSPRKGIYRLAD